MKSVSTRPGEIDTTRIRGARARASDLVILSTAAFEAQYITLLPIAVTAARDEILTTTAPPGCVLLSSKGRSARTAAKGPRTLVARMRSIKLSSKLSRSPCGTNRVVPAQLTSTSQRPYRALIVDARPVRAALSVTGAESAA